MPRLNAYLILLYMESSKNWDMYSISKVTFIQHNKWTRLFPAEFCSRTGMQARQSGNSQLGIGRVGCLHIHFAQRRHI